MKKTILSAILIFAAMTVLSGCSEVEAAEKVSSEPQGQLLSTERNVFAEVAEPTFGFCRYEGCTEGAERGQYYCRRHAGSDRENDRFYEGRGNCGVNGEYCGGSENRGCGNR